MNKKILISATVVALMLSICLFTVSVIAAFGQVFGVNNRITFVGKDEYLIFQIQAEVTGTTNDGSDELKHTWNYDEENSLNEETWNIAETLIFEERDKTVSEIYILYNFTITNNEEGKKIRAYLDQPDIDTACLDFDIINSSGNEITELIVDSGMTDTIILRLRPINERFLGARECNLNLHIEGVE